METPAKRNPTLFIFACILFAAGVVCLGLSFVVQLEPHVFKGLLYISLALLAFGAGEIINHPRQQAVGPATGKNGAAQKMHRKRKVSSLGNLCDIGALLLFFAGLAAFFYPAA